MRICKKKIVLRMLEMTHRVAMAGAGRRIAGAKGRKMGKGGKPPRMNRGVSEAAEALLGMGFGETMDDDDTLVCSVVLKGVKVICLTSACRCDVPVHHRSWSFKKCFGDHSIFRGEQWQCSAASHCYCGLRCLLSWLLAL